MDIAKKLIKQLDLQPHPEEGGYFKEIYRSEQILSAENLPSKYKEERNLCTSIYFLLTKGTFSRMHRLGSDEIYHFYTGGPVELLLLHPSGKGEKVLLGNDIENGQRPQIVVPAGIWQGSMLTHKAEYALLGTTVAPGFEYQDYENADKSELLSNFPKFQTDIEQLCL